MFLIVSSLNYWLHCSTLPRGVFFCWTCNIISCLFVLHLQKIQPVTFTGPDTVEISMYKATLLVSQHSQHSVMLLCHSTYQMKKKNMSGCELTSLNWVNCFLMHFFFSSHAVICYSWKANRVSYQRTPEHKQTVDRLLGVSQPLQAQLSNLVQQMYMQKRNTKRQIKPLLCDLLLDIIVVHSPVALLVLEQSD